MGFKKTSMRGNNLKHTSKVEFAVLIIKYFFERKHWHLLLGDW